MRCRKGDWVKWKDEDGHELVFIVEGFMKSCLTGRRILKTNEGIMWEHDVLERRPPQERP